MFYSLVRESEKNSNKSDVLNSNSHFPSAVIKCVPWMSFLGSVSSMDLSWLD